MGGALSGTEVRAAPGPLSPDARLATRDRSFVPQVLRKWRRLRKAWEDGAELAITVKRFEEEEVPQTIIPAEAAPKKKKKMAWFCGKKKKTKGSGASAGLLEDAERWGANADALAAIKAQEAKADEQRCTLPTHDCKKDASGKGVTARIPPPSRPLG